MITVNMAFGDPGCETSVNVNLRSLSNQKYLKFFEKLEKILPDINNVMS